MSGGSFDVAQNADGLHANLSFHPVGQPIGIKCTIQVGTFWRKITGFSRNLFWGLLFVWINTFRDLAMLKSHRRRSSSTWTNSGCRDSFVGPRNCPYTSRTMYLSYGIMYSTDPWVELFRALKMDSKRMHFIILGCFDSSRP